MGNNLRHFLLYIPSSYYNQGRLFELAGRRAKAIPGKINPENMIPFKACCVELLFLHRSQISDKGEP